MPGPITLGLDEGLKSIPVAAQYARSREQLLHAYANLPLAFVENRGQTNASVRYHARGPHYVFYLTREEIVMRFLKRSGESGLSGRSDALAAAHNSTARVRSLNDPATGEQPTTQEITLALRFMGANPQAVLEGEARTPGDANYLRGDDPTRWHTQLPRYAQVVYRELWPGVDMMLRGQHGELKYEFRVRPGARLADIALGYRGATGLAIDSAGGLLIATAWGA